MVARSSNPLPLITTMNYLFLLIIHTNGLFPVSYTFKRVTKLIIIRGNSPICAWSSGSRIMTRQICRTSLHDMNLESDVVVPPLALPPPHAP